MNSRPRRPFVLQLILTTHVAGRSRKEGATTLTSTLHYHPQHPFVTGTSVSRREFTPDNTGPVQWSFETQNQRSKRVAPLTMGTTRGPHCPVAEPLLSRNVYTSTKTVELVNPPKKKKKMFHSPKFRLGNELSPSRL